MQQELYHPAVFHQVDRPGGIGVGSPLAIPRGVDEATVDAEGRTVKLTNLRKLFWPKLNITKRDLLQYYSDISPVLLPHLKHRAMVMKRYPNGAEGDFFFMKHAPPHRPQWVSICSILHGSGNLVDFPVIDHLAELLWVVNLGCIDLNQWYAPCDDVDRPDYLHFDLDPTPEASFDQALETSIVVRDALRSLGMESYAKTTGSRGIHLYVPIVRGPSQKEVWTFAKAFAQLMAKRRPDLITAEYKIAKRPAERILVDYNQNAWGRTLASVYSVRPRPLATVSTPVTWEEIERGIEIDDFRMGSVPARVAKVGDLWQPLLSERGRFDLGSLK